MGNREIQTVDLRNWFAAQALNGILASPHCLPIQANELPREYANRIARRAYEFADAMMKAKEAEPTI